MYYVWQEIKYLTRYDKFHSPQYAAQGGPRFGANRKKTYRKAYLFGCVFFAQGCFFSASKQGLRAQEHTTEVPEELQNAHG
jgi:hypothetical protein